MSQSVTALCMVCGRRRTLDPYREPRDWDAKTATRRCATCRTDTDHFWINHPWENQLEEARVRLEQAERRLAESRAQLDDMGIRVIDVGGCLSRKISVIRHLDDGTFVIQLGTDWPAPHALIGLKRALRVILNHDDEKWYVWMDDGEEPVAAIGVCDFVGAPGPTPPVR